MKILLVNKFLYPKGGAETYVIRLGKYLEEHGNEVQYFGTYDEKNILKNKLNLYVTQLHLEKNNIKSMFNVLKLIYSREAKRKMYILLKDFKPDLIILNNIEYHITPSIILAIKKYKKKINNKSKLFYVAHDYQLICPSHGLFDVNIDPCEKCLKGDYWNCYKTKCLKNSKLKSLIGSLDSFYWHKKKIYKYVDKIICPSKFLKSKLDTNYEFKCKTVAIHNFVDGAKKTNYNKEDYILYFGALTVDKGILTLLDVCKKHPEIKFKFAGYGPLEEKIKGKNIEFLGFKSGEELEKIISCAKISIHPSQMYENCPFSVIESQMYGTPVIVSNVGGIPELIIDGKTGYTFEAGNSKDLEKKILLLFSDKNMLNKFSNNCKNMIFETKESYCNKLLKLYRGEKIENI